MKMDDNDTSYLMCVTDHLYGPLDKECRKVLAQRRAGTITAKFGMRALARLSRLRSEARRRKIDGG